MCVCACCRGCSRGCGGGGGDDQDDQDDDDDVDDDVPVIGGERGGNMVRYLHVQIYCICYTYIT